MANRDATIRITVEGTQESSSRIDQLEKRYAQLVKTLERAQSVYEQKVAGFKKTEGVRGGAPELVMMEGELVKKRRDIERTEQMLGVERQARFEKELANYHKRISQGSRESEHAVVSAKIEEESQEQKTAAATKGVLERQQTQYNEIQDEHKRELKRQDIKEWGKDREARLDKERLASRQTVAKKYAQIDKDQTAENDRITKGGFKAQINNLNQEETIWNAVKKGIDRQAKNQERDGDSSGRSIGRVGGMFVVGRGIGQMLGDVSGNSQVGQAASQIAEGFLLGGELTGAIATATVVVGAYFNAIQDGLLQASKAATDFAHAIGAASEESARLATDLIPITKFGSQMESAASKHRATGSELLEEVAATQPMNIWARRLHTISQDVEFAYSSRTAAERDTGEQRANRTRLRNSAFQLELEADELGEIDRQRGAAWTMRQTQEKSKYNMLATQQMGPGLARDAKMLKAQADAARAEQKLTFAEQNEQVKFGVEQSEKALDNAVTEEEMGKKTKNLSPEALKVLSEAKRNALLDLDKAREARGRLPKQQAEEEAWLARDAAQKEANWRIELARQTRTELLAVSESIISIQRAGYDRDLAALNAHFEEQKAAYIENGRSIINLVAKHEADKLALRARAEEKFQDMDREADNRLRMTEGSPIQREFAGQDVAREELDRMGRLARFTKEQRDSLELQRKEQRDADLKAEGRSMTDRLHPDRAYDDWNAHFIGVAHASEMSDETQRYLRRTKIRELLSESGVGEGGQFMDSMSFARKMQTDILTKNEIPQAMLDGIMKIYHEGLKLRG